MHTIGCSLLLVTLASSFFWERGRSARAPWHASSRPRWVVAAEGRDSLAHRRGRPAPVARPRGRARARLAVFGRRRERVRRGWPGCGWLTEGVCAHTPWASRFRGSSIDDPRRRPHRCAHARADRGGGNARGVDGAGRGLHGPLRRLGRAGGLAPSGLVRLVVPECQNAGRRPVAGLTLSWRACARLPVNRKPTPRPPTGTRAGAATAGGQLSSLARVERVMSSFAQVTAASTSSMTSSPSAASA